MSGALRRIRKVAPRKMTQNIEDANRPDQHAISIRDEETANFQYNHFLHNACDRSVRPYAEHDWRHNLWHCQLIAWLF
jgi:hypothetical protein